MRLLNTKTHRLVDFTGKGIPAYAILSHCWEDEEITFRHMYESNMVDEEPHLLKPAHEMEKLTEEFPLMAEMQRFHVKRLTARKGWQKIVNFCKEVSEKGLLYGWIDTCCIDKSSSSELQEAINSMWKWYRHAKVCLVYMNDVFLPENSEHSDFENEFSKSRWFTRGWTLQELLAPSPGAVMFLDANWIELGSDSRLQILISGATRIPREVFVNRPRSIRSICVAEKMFWASHRKTTREEDMAYCLLGLFDISMPLLYGEGATGAFQRLQIEIMRSTTDESILAWSGHVTPFGSSALATRVSLFSEGNLKRLYSTVNTNVRQPFGMTQCGLQIELNLMRKSWKRKSWKYATYPRAIIEWEVYHNEGLEEPSEGEWDNLIVREFFIAPLRVTGQGSRTAFIPIERSYDPTSQSFSYRRLPGLIFEQCDLHQFEKDHPRQFIFLE